MAILPVTNRENHEQNKFVESTGTSGQVGVVVLNPDGSNIAGGGSSSGVIVDGVSSSIKATVKNYTNDKPLTVRLTDTNGDYVAAGAGTQYTEDAASAADPVGGMLIGRRRDTLVTNEVSADGDNIALNATNKGQLHVKLADTVTVDASGTAVPVTDNSGSLTVDGSVSLTSDDADLDSGAGTDNHEVIAIGVAASGGHAVITGDVANGLDVDVTRVGGNVTVVQGTGTNLHMVVDSGTVSTITNVVHVDDNSGSLTVDNAGTFVTQENGALLTSAQLIDDVIYTSGDALSKTAGIAAQFDDVTPGAVTENKMAPVRMSSRREIYSTIRDAAGNERGLNVDANGAIAVTATNATASNLKVAATLDAETTKVLGTVRNADGSGNLWTSNSTTYTAKFGQDSNLLGTLGTAFSTAGKVDVKVASGDIASGAIASGAIASGAVASGAFAAGSIAVGAITAGDTSIATTEDTARAAGEHLVKVGLSRLDTPVANANVSTDGDYTNFTADNFGKLWVSGTIPEDTAHVAGEALTVMGARRIDTIATSSGTSGDWSTVNQTAEGALWVTVTPSATGGATTMNATSSDGATALTSTAQVIKASAGTLKGYYIYNPNSSAQFVQFYNTAAASVTVGTTNPLFMITIPATSAANLWMTDGINFSNAGWSWAATATAGGNGAPSTALDAVAWYI